MREPPQQTTTAGKEHLPEMGCEGGTGLNMHIQVTPQGKSLLSENTALCPSPY